MKVGFSGVNIHPRKWGIAWFEFLGLRLFLSDLGALDKVKREAGAHVYLKMQLQRCPRNGKWAKE